MTDVATLLAEFLDELQGGAMPEVSLYMKRADDDAARRELAEGIDGVLAFAGVDVRWPRDAGSGEFVAAEEAKRVEGIVARAFASVKAGAQVDQSNTLGALSERAGMSLDELADRVLDRSGLPADGEKRAGFRQWIAALESGARTIEGLTSRAREAIAVALNVGAETLAQLRPASAVAFRESDLRGTHTVADALEVVVDEFADELEGGQAQKYGDAETDEWFTGERSDRGETP